MELKKGLLYDFYHFTFLFLNARNALFSILNHVHLKYFLSLKHSGLSCYYLAIPKAATSSPLLLFTQGQPQTVSTAYSCNTGGENINATLQRIVWISSAIMWSVMTRSITIRREWVHRKAALCKKRLERLAWLAYEGKDWKRMCSLFVNTYWVWINASLSRARGQGCHKNKWVQFVHE